MPDNDWMSIPRPQTKDTSWMDIKRPAGVTGQGFEAIGGAQQIGKESDYKFQMKFGQNNDLLRAQAQPWYEQAYKSVGNAIANTATGLLGGFGYLPEVFDKDQDYNNSWIF